MILVQKIVLQLVPFPFPVQLPSPLHWKAIRWKEMTTSKHFVPMADSSRVKWSADENDIEKFKEVTLCLEMKNKWKSKDEGDAGRGEYIEMTIW